jgi:hypothetical protein
MAKIKLTQPPYPPVPWQPLPAPRLFVQAATAMGELVLAGIGVVGAVVIINWMLVGFDVTSRPVRRQAQPAPPPATWLSRVDRWSGERHCWPTYRSPPVQRFYARDGA